MKSDYNLIEMVKGKDGVYRAASEYVNRKTPILYDSKLRLVTVTGGLIDLLV